MVIARKRAEGKQDLMMEEDDEDEDEDMLQDKSIYCVVEGRINLNKTPRYMQIGELNRYVPE
jgi:centrosomal protein CEP76